jgi:Zn-finger nucleic acid-binding protein
MGRKHYAENSGIVVDQCMYHGTWFERGRLEELIEFAENGGLKIAAKRKAAAMKKVYPAAQMETWDEHGAIIRKNTWIVRIIIAFLRLLSREP